MPYRVAAASGHLGEMHMTPPPAPGFGEEFMDEWEPDGTVHAVREGELRTLCGEPVDGHGLRLFPSRSFHTELTSAALCPTCAREAGLARGAT